MKLNQEFVFKNIKKTILKLLLLMAFLGVWGCASKPVGEFKEQVQEETQALQVRLNLEPLYALSWSSNELFITVKSTGCTQAEHFTLSITGQEVSIIRKQQDYCRAMPIVKTIKLKTKLPKNWLLANPLIDAPSYMRK